jgi:DNA modification methylase
MVDYDQFLKNKVRLAQQEGFDCDLNEINPALKLHNRLMVKWLVEGGRRACFAAFGLHKTVTQLETVRITLTKTGGRGLIIAPLGVRAEFTKDAINILGWESGPKFIRRIEEAGETGIYITNYETVRDGKLDPRLFSVASLDEASILRGLGGSKTFREFMRLFTGDAGPNGDRRGTECVPYRFVATATPSPNDYIELLAYADFLGVMDVSQAKTRFFKRDSTKADKLTIHAHKEEEFWLWMASWALFVSKPSDLTGDEADDIGYNMPPMDIRWHEIPTDHSEAGTTKSGQYKMIAEVAIGLEGAAREKRVSLSARIEKMASLYFNEELIAPSPKDLAEQVIDTSFRHIGNYWVLRQLWEGNNWADSFGMGGASHPVSWQGDSKGISFTDTDGKKKQISIAQIKKRAEQWKVNHAILWHDLEDERKMIEKLFPNSKSVFGTQDLEKREIIVSEFSQGQIPLIAGKPSMLGSGTNLQKFCSWAIYSGIGFKFNDFIQSMHRLLRFGQTGTVRIDLIYTSAEIEIRRQLERKWKQHNVMVTKMTEIIKKYGLSQQAMAQLLTRKMGAERIEINGENYTLANNDNVKELPLIESNSIGLIVTSIPFSTQYEYSPNYADFGHTENNAEFFEQMDYLTPELLRVLKPGRIAAIHVKDRITPGGITGLGFQTTYPFHIDTYNHYKKHGFEYLGMKTIVTDVVRENNQTYRLGWTEQCKDGSKMGVGMPEYLLLFRKPQTDTTKGYADEPVVKDKAKYSRSRWQVDAHGFDRSSGNRCLTPDELSKLDHDVIFKEFKSYTLNHVYDFEHHVKIGETLDAKGKLPTSFMLLQPQSWSDEVWTDVTRMLTLNGSQWSKGKEMHLCPLQFDICDRVITKMSMEGDIVLDPFGGLMTVPYRALKLNRKAYGIELNPSYFTDGAQYCKSVEAAVNMPSFFDLLPDLA